MMIDLLLNTIKRLPFSIVMLNKNPSQSTPAKTACPSDLQGRSHPWSPIDKKFLINKYIDFRI